MRVMSVPQKQRSGPNVSTICCKYLWMLRYGYGSVEVLGEGPDAAKAVVDLLEKLGVAR